MAWTRASSRIEPGPDGPGAAPPAGPGAPPLTRAREPLTQRPRDSLLVEPPRRLWRLVLGGAVLFLAGGVLGVVLTVELLGADLAPRPAGTLVARPVDTARSGTEAPPPAAISPAPEQLRRDAERMQATAELAALRQATAAERARLEALGDQRDVAAAELARLREQAAEAAVPPVATPAPAVVAAPPPMPAAPAAPAPAVAAVVPPPPPPPPAVPRPRNRAEARAEGRVQLHYLAGSPAAQQAAEEAAAVLRDAGVEGVELRPAPEVPGNRLVRYHRAEDAGMAARLAGRLGRGWALQDSRGYDPGGAARGLEIWLPDR